MSHHQDQRRKIPVTNVLKHIPSSNSLLSGKDRRRTDKSKEKENQKLQKVPILNPRKTTLPQQHQPYQDLETKKIANGINFRNLKSGLGKKSAKQIIRVVNQPTAQQHQGISINVNIQNMISGKKTVKNNLSEINSQRSSSLIKHQKSCDEEAEIKGKKKKIIDDFQCNQELQFTSKQSGGSSNNSAINLSKVNTSRLERKVSEKKPLISYTSQKTQNQHILSKPQHMPILQINKPKHAQDIKDFEAIEGQINMQSQSEMVVMMDYRQQSYIVDPTYIQKKQKNLKWTMRGILLEWMMHVCSQFSLKRQTYHIALVLTDNYLAKSPHIHKNDIQLVGATTMFIASKLQEFQPLSSKQFSRSTNQLYSSSQIKQMETRICKTLKFNLNPPTIAMWANRIMTQWDQYMELSDYAKSHPLFNRNHNGVQLSVKYFKKADQSAYNNFRVVMQLLDCCMLDVQSLQYRPQFLVCSFMYLVLGKQLNDFKTRQIISDFPRSSLYLLDQSNWFNDLFKNFVQDSFGFLLLDLLPTVQYSATYFILPIIIDQPNLRNEPKEPSDDINYEQYCSFQTYNANSLTIVNRRNRDIYQ